MKTARETSKSPSNTAESGFEGAVDALERCAEKSRDLDDEDTQEYQRFVAKLLRETAEIARHVSGGLPATWSHYIVARKAFPSDARLADALGVDRSRVARWKQGQAPDPENESRLRALDIVVSLLTGYLDKRAIPDWLHGLNPHLGDRRPIDVIRSGRLSQVVAAIEAEQSGAHA